MDYSDYDISNIRQVLDVKKDKFFFIDRDDKPNYAYFAIDPLDHDKVNAQLELVLQSGLIVLRCIKDSSAGDEIFISLGMALWAVHFRSKWNKSNEITNNSIMRKVKEIYSIEDDFANSVFNNDYICTTIANKIEEFDSWKRGVNYYLTHFITPRGSGYYNASLQCLSHIPALARLILETDLFEYVFDNSKEFISLTSFIIQLLKNNKCIDNVVSDPFMSYNTVENLISTDQYLGIQYMDFFTNDMRFAKSNYIFDVIKYYLFCFYVDIKTYCLEKSHCHSIRKLQIGLPLKFMKPESDEVECLKDLIDYCKKDGEIEEDYQCPYCYNKNTGKGKFKNSFYTYPRILLINLERVKNEDDEVKYFYNKDVKYPRYLKFVEVYYQLIGILVYRENKFISYFLHSDKKWYEDDGLEIKVVSASDACKQPKAYYFIYKKYNDDIQQLADIPEILDMIIDSYGKNYDDQIAISLKLPISSRGESNSCGNIIKEYENLNCQNLNQFRKFINVNKLNIHIWRYHNKNNSDHERMYNSCVDNGTSGFQVDFLLRERVVENSGTTLQSKDKYIMKDKHNIITTRQRTNFENYLKTLISGDSKKIYFTDLKRPMIHETYGNNVLQNKYSSYDDWIIIRTKQYKKGEINKNTYNPELAYYKFLSAKRWIQNQPDLQRGEYPQFFSPGQGLHINLWWDTSMFHYTKHDHNFSIFFNNDGVNDIPYIKNYYILQYTTITDIVQSTTIIENDVNKYDYSISNGYKILENYNHGALDGNKYHLLTSHLFEDAADECLTQLYKNMNYILEYGEFKYPHYDTINRWGGISDYTREYLPYPIRQNINQITYQNGLSEITTMCGMSNSKLIEINAEELKKNKIQRNQIVNDDQVAHTSRNVITNFENNKKYNKSNNTTIISASLKANEIKKKIVDIVLPNIKNILQNHENDKLKKDIMKKITQFRKDKLENSEPFPRKINRHLSDLFDLTESDE